MFANADTLLTLYAVANSPVKPFLKTGFGSTLELFIRKGKKNLPFGKQ